jgi:hypothetical protein
VPPWEHGIGDPRITAINNSGGIQIRIGTIILSCVDQDVHGATDIGCGQVLAAIAIKVPHGLTQSQADGCAARRFRVAAAFRATDVPINQLLRCHESSVWLTGRASAARSLRPLDFEVMYVKHRFIFCLWAPHRQSCEAIGRTNR